MLPGEAVLVKTAYVEVGRGEEGTLLVMLACPDHSVGQLWFLPMVLWRLWPGSGTHMTCTACEGCRLEGLGSRLQPWGGLYGILRGAQSSSVVRLLSLYVP